MKRMVVITLALSALVMGAALGSTAAATTRASLSVMRVTPLELRGTGFHSMERVVVRILGRDRAVKRVTASRRGTFVVRFPGVSTQACGMVITAAGARGSYAVLRSPVRRCPPPPRP